MTRRGFVRSVGGVAAAVAAGQGVARAQAAGAGRRRVLERVPRIGFADAECGGGIPFPSALTACLQYLGEDPAYDYTYNLATSGAAFAALWDTRPWSYVMDLTDRAANSGWVEPVERALAAVGYQYEFLPKGGPESDASLRERIMASIAEGRPVLATGVVGPPACGIITGYDEGGDVLIGWSYFQAMPSHGAAEDFEPCGYYRKRDWFVDTGTVVLIGDKTQDPPAAETQRSALLWAVELAETPLLERCHCGLAAYTAWADALLRDEDFPADDLEMLLARLDCHFGPLAAAAEGRHHAAAFARRVGEQEVGLAELDAAARCYDDEVALLVRIAEVQGGWDPHAESTARKLAEPVIRREIASLIAEARDKDAEAIDCIRRALPA